MIKSFTEDKNRILITIGFGDKYSKHLKGFKKGTLIRQNRVDFVNKYLGIYIVNYYNFFYNFYLYLSFLVL